jgi:hypothetical protein
MIHGERMAEESIIHVIQFLVFCVMNMQRYAKEFYRREINNEESIFLDHKTNERDTIESPEIDLIIGLKRGSK